MNVLRACLVLVATVVTVACSAPGPIVKRDALEPREQALLSARSTIVVRRPLPAFQIYKTTDQYLQMVGIPFGLAGIWGAYAVVVAAEDHRSDPFIRDNQLTDPAYAISGKLGKYFGPRFGVQFAGLTDELVETLDPHELVESLKGRADFALDIRTAYWGLTTSPLYPTYRLAYRASMRVIDIQSGATLASGQCKYWPDSPDAEPLDELTTANAALLKEKIRSAVEACAAQFTDVILDRPDPMS